MRSLSGAGESVALGMTHSYRSGALKSKALRSKPTDESVQSHTSRLPAPGLQHVRFVQGADRQAFHSSLQVFADFK